MQVSVPSVATMLLPTITITIYFLESSWKITSPETLHRSGCFDSHIYIIYLIGFVLLIYMELPHALTF